MEFKEISENQLERRKSYMENGGYAKCVEGSTSRIADCEKKLKKQKRKRRRQREQYGHIKKKTKKKIKMLKIELEQLKAERDLRERRYSRYVNYVEMERMFYAIMLLERLKGKEDVLEEIAERQIVRNLDSKQPAVIDLLEGEYRECKR